MSTEMQSSINDSRLADEQRYPTLNIETIQANVSLVYFAEGAANVVYKIVQPAPEPNLSSDLGADAESYGPTTPPITEIDEPFRHNPSLEGILLRLRKDLSTAVPVLEAQDSFEKVIRPLFQEEDLVQQKAVRLPQGLIRTCNETLLEMEKSGERLRSRHGVYLNENEEHGTLVKDMSPELEQGYVTIELKPKWLAQSPSAPSSAKRCRTCALQAMRDAQRAKKQEYKAMLPETADFCICRLALVSHDEAIVQNAVRNLLKHQPELEYASHDLMVRLVDFFRKDPLLRSLRSLQQDLDPRGVLAPGLDMQKLCIAMTLRDCTLFIKVGTCNHKDVSYY
ncbi:Inositol-pentakisphosphate 2-kinase [Bachmanniomyces sp. S44760]|nr:Inositol-pentakisphosphate 2-kinase [Bachmanniomyces sp. S44760]